MATIKQPSPGFNIMKNKRWSAIDIAELKNLTARFWTDEQIARRINRSVSAVNIKRNRLIGKFIKCLDCGKIIKVKGGKRLRCDSCSQMKTDGEKSERAAKWYAKNKGYMKLRRDQIRFGGLRELVIQRDRERCVNCGMTRIEHREKWNCDITVDHVDGKGRNSKERNDNKDNLMTLCLSCHGKKDVKRRIQDWSMCSEWLKKFNKMQKENDAKSTIQLLEEGKRPIRKKNNRVYWE